MKTANTTGTDRKQKLVMPDHSHATVGNGDMAEEGLISIRDLNDREKLK